MLIQTLSVIRRVPYLRIALPEAIFPTGSQDREEEEDRRLMGKMPAVMDLLKIRYLLPVSSQDRADK